MEPAQGIVGRLPWCAMCGITRNDNYCPPMGESGEHPAGWHPDPNDATRLRYWDGNQWTDQYAAVVQPPAPAPMPASVPVTPRKPPMSTRFGEWFNPKPWWVRALLIVGAMIVALGAAIAWSIVGDKAESDSDGGSDNASPSMSVTVDKCAFDSDGWVEAGGMVTNRGDSKANVKVNLLVSGKYVDFDYVMGVGAGDTATWSVSEPDTTRGGCSAELDEP